MENADATIDFAVLADKFYIAPPSGSGKGVRPFAVYTSPTEINGVTVPAGTYLDGNLLATGTITGDKIRAQTEINAPIISGGQINISDKFIVDAQGNLTGKSGTFEGTVLADKISGTIDVESMKRSAWTPKFNVIYSRTTINTLPEFDALRDFSGSYVSYGSIDAYFTSSSSRFMGSVLYEIDLFTTKQVIVQQKLIIIDDRLKVFVNGSEVINTTNNNSAISFTLPKGSVKLQYMLINTQLEGAITLAGDFIDNVNVKFA